MNTEKQELRDLKVKASQELRDIDVLLFVLRKFSKTTFVVAIAIYGLLLGDKNAQVYVAANSYKQAPICFKVIKEILKAHDRKLRHFKINKEVVHN